MRYGILRRLVVAVAVAMAFSLPGEVTVVNTGFQDFTDGKVAGWSLTGHFHAEERGGHNGSAGLVWRSDGPSDRQECAFQRIQLEPGKPYRFMTQARTEGFSGSADLCIEWFGKKGWMGGSYLGQKMIKKKDSDWTVYESDTAPIPSEAEYCQLMYYVGKGSKGTVQFDNVVVMPRERKPVAFVFSSAYRDTADSGEVRFRAALYPPESEDVRAEFAYRDADGKVRRGEPTEITSEQAMLRLDVAGLALGQQEVSCALYAKDGRKIGEASTWFVREKKLPVRMVAIDEHGRCRVEGKPFFPVGLYTSRLTEETAKDLADGGFNCAMPYGITGKKELDIAARHGLRICADVRGLDPSSEKWRKSITAIKRHPGLLAWYTNDEAPLADLPALGKKYDFLVRNDAEHPVYIVMDRLHDLREFIPTYDVLGMDPYPVEDKPVSHVTDMIRGTQTANFGERPLWNVPQVFAWSDYKMEKRGKRFPTDAELRSMCWQHIACGANGLMGYCYDTMARLRKTDAAEADRRWKAMRKVFGEIKSASDVLLSVEPAPSIAGCPPELAVRMWRKDGRVWLLACNTTASPRKDRLSVGGVEVVVELGPLGVSFAPVVAKGKMDSIYTVPHELDCLVKGGHIQGASCDESGIYLSYGGGVVKIGWDGRKIVETESSWHTGDCFAHDGRLYAALSFSKPRDGVRGWLAAWDATTLKLLEESPVEAVHGVDGLVVLNNRIYYGIGVGYAPHGGTSVGIADMSLKKVGEKEVDLGYWIHYGVQTMATDGKSLFFGNYGAPADKGNPKKFNCTRLSSDLAVEKNMSFGCSEGFGLVPQSVSMRDGPVFFAVRALGGNMQGWRKDPVNNPPRIRIDFYEYANGKFKDISRRKPEK